MFAIKTPRRDEKLIENDRKIIYEAFKDYRIGDKFKYLDVEFIFLGQEEDSFGIVWAEFEYKNLWGDITTFILRPYYLPIFEKHFKRID